MIYCLVNPDGDIQVDDGTAPDASAAAAGTQEAEWSRFGVDLEYRRVTSDPTSGGLPGRKAPDERTGRELLERCLSSPESLMAFVRETRLQKIELGKLLVASKRLEYLDACAALERRVTEECRDQRDPCLEDGCAFEEDGEACLNAVLSSGSRTRDRWIDLWVEFFADRRNRIEAWRR